MLSFADIREFSTADERFSRCLFCGKEMVVLPNDRRAGSCFDCLVLSVPEARPCPACGAAIPGDARAAGCSECGWFPMRD